MSLFIIFAMSACVRIFPSNASLTLTQQPFFGMHMNPKNAHAIGTYSLQLGRMQPSPSPAMFNPKSCARQQHRSSTKRKVAGGRQ